MNTINLQKLITEKNLDKKEVAKHLFPDNLYPTMAMNRIIKGEAYLDEAQISRLAAWTGLTVAELFEENWKISSGKDCLVFTYKNYKAELDRNRMITTIYDKNTVLHEVALHTPLIPLSDYINQLNLIINKQS